MARTMMNSKIHRATLAQADLHQVGSVTVDEDLLDADDKILATGLGPAEVVPGSGLVRGDTPAGR